VIPSSKGSDDSQNEWSIATQKRRPFVCFLGDECLRGRRRLSFGELLVCFRPGLAFAGGDESQWQAHLVGLAFFDAVIRLWIGERSSERPTHMIGR